MSSDPETLTLLRAAAAGDEEARDRAWARLHAEIIRVVRAQRRRWSGDWTLETHALASEVFIKLCGNRPLEPRDRKHFFTTLAKAVRQILLNHAEAKRALKRGGDAVRVPLDAVEESLMTEAVSDSVLAVDEALKRFESVDARAARVVELRFFTGLTYEEIAATLGVSRATAVRDWEAARLWLAREIGPSLPVASGGAPAEEA